jgi:cytochrome c-type biogenesis protein CcmH
MMMFWFLSAVLVAVVMAMLAPSLLRSREAADQDRDRQNVLIAQERIAELEGERDEGVLSDKEFEQAKREVESALLIDVDQRDEGEGEKVSGMGKGTFAAIALSLPLIGVPIYFLLGEPQLAGTTRMAVTKPAGGHQAGEPGTVAEMVEKLTNRLKENPQDTEGWFMLGRTMMVLEDYDKAVTAFEATYSLAGEEPSVMLALADSIAMSKGGDMGDPRIRELVHKALAVDSENVTGLWLAGLIETEAGNNPEALKYFQQLRPLVADDAASVSEVDKLIARVGGAQANEGATASVQPEPAQATPAAVGDEAITVRVVIDAALAGRVAESDTVYIYARATEGPRFPLAASRHRVSELPLELTLSDANAVMPMGKLSSFSEVLVGARVSKSGDAMAKAGDLRGEISPVQVGQGEPVEIVIDTIVP